jgi:hypothetical protein
LQHGESLPKYHPGAHHHGGDQWLIMMLCLASAGLRRSRRSASPSGSTGTVSPRRSAGGKA